MIGFALARYDYQPLRDDELQLIKGQRVTVLEKSSDGWWKGQCNDQTGWFPSNYVEEETQQQQKLNNIIMNNAAIQQQQQQSKSYLPKTKNGFDTNANNNSSNCLLLAIHSFKGEFQKLLL